MMDYTLLFTLGRIVVHLKLLIMRRSGVDTRVS